MSIPVPSERTVRLLGWTALLVGIAFLGWLLTFAAAGTGAELPRPEFTASPKAGVEDSTFVAAWRALNATLAGLVAFGLWLRWFDCRSDRHEALKAGELTMFVAALVGQIHMLVMQGPLTIAVPFVTVAAASSLAGLILTRDRS